MKLVGELYDCTREEAEKYMDEKYPESEKVTNEEFDEYINWMHSEKHYDMAEWESEHETDLVNGCLHILHRHMEG